MRWYDVKWWRLAISRNQDGVTSDNDGEWHRFLGPIWVLTTKRRAL